MSKLKPGALFTQAWVADVSRVTRMPSWIARKAMSTRPPTPSSVPSSSTAPELRTDAPPTAVQDTPAPPPVHIATAMVVAELADENAALRTQITEMAATMAGLRREVLAASEGELITLALAIARRVVGRELESEPALATAWAREAVEVLAAKDGVVIAVARDVRDSTPTDAWDAIEVEHRLLTEAQLEPGVIEVRSSEGTVTTGTDARLAAVASAMGIGES